MPNDPLIRAHARLMDCHRKIRQEFATLNDPSLESFLGGRDSEQLREQVRRHGDGYTLRSVPARVKGISATEELVLIVGRFPWLGAESRFDPHEPLTEIPYWQQRLRPKVTMPDGSERQCRFLIWQDSCPVHGSNLDQARHNQEFLCGTEQIPRFTELIRCQAEQSRCLLLAWADWLREGKSGRQLILVTDQRDPVGRSQIPEIAGKTDLQLSTRLWGRGSLVHDLMDQIEAILADTSER